MHSKYQLWEKVHILTTSSKFWQNNSVAVSAKNNKKKKITHFKISATMEIHISTVCHEFVSFEPNSVFAKELCF